MEDLQLLIQFHLHAQRQGPGSKEETLRAIELAGLDRNQELKVADIGCGTGASTLILAQSLNAKITAIDLFPDFLEQLTLKLNDEMKSQVNTQALPMEDLPFGQEELDLIWSEGAIYNIGFEKGIKNWHRFIKTGGTLAVSEITWLTASRPIEIEEYWESEYPEIAMASEKIKILENSGYKLLGYFPLTSYCWRDNYYAPMEARFESFLTENGKSDDAVEIVKAEKREIELYEKYHDHYSYGFYVAEKL